LARGHDPGGHVVLQRENGDRRLSDREGRGRDHRRQQSLEALARLGQLGRDARGRGVNLATYVMSDQSNNAFPIEGGQAFAGINQTARQPVDPQPAVRVEHHLNDHGIVQKTSDRGT
jgi:hypothetical protein